MRGIDAWPARTVVLVLATTATVACSHTKPRIQSPKPPASLVERWSARPSQPDLFPPMPPNCMDAATLQRTPHVVLEPDPRDPRADVLLVHVEGVASERPGEPPLQLSSARSTWEVSTELGQRALRTCAPARTKGQAGLRVEVVSPTASNTYCGHWMLREPRFGWWYADLLVEPNSDLIRFSIDEKVVHELRRPAQDPRVHLAWIQARGWLGVRIVDSGRVGQHSTLEEWAAIGADESHACWRFHSHPPRAGLAFSELGSTSVSDVFSAVEVDIPAAFARALAALRTDQLQAPFGAIDSASEVTWILARAGYEVPGGLAEPLQTTPDGIEVRAMRIISDCSPDRVRRWAEALLLIRADGTIETRSEQEYAEQCPKPPVVYGAP